MGPQSKKSPQPKLVQLRTMRLSGASDPPRLHLDVFLPTMDGITGPDESQKGSQAPKTPERSNGGSPLPTRPRNASNALTPSAAHRINSMASPTASNGGDSSTLDQNSSPWSSAVGRATTGKSGRVIERLQGENDRLRRELTLESLRRDEEQKKGETARGMMEGLRITNGNLTQISEVDKASLARKDRKIEELKTDLEDERTKRSTMENQLRVVTQDSETLEAQLRAAAHESAEGEKRATAQYEALSSSWKHLEEGYTTQVGALQKDVYKLAEDGAEDRAKLKRLALISEQQKKEIEHLQAAKEAVDRGFERYKKEVDESTRRMRETALRNEAEHDRVMHDAAELLSSMRHVINVKENLRHDV